MEQQRVSYLAERTFPNKTSSTSSDLIAARSTAALMAWEPSWTALKLETELLNVRREALAVIDLPLKHANRRTGCRDNVDGRRHGGGWKLSEGVELEKIMDRARGKLEARPPGSHRLTDRPTDRHATPRTAIEDRVALKLSKSIPHHQHHHGRPLRRVSLDPNTFQLLTLQVWQFHRRGRI